MSTNHLPRQDLALYVLGELEPAATARLEEHVARCASCAEALASEAQLEMKLQNVMPAALREMQTPPIAPGPLPFFADLPLARRRWPMVTMLAASLAVVIGLALTHLMPPLRTTSGAGESALSELSAMSAMSAAESYGEWFSEAGTPQCALPRVALSIQPPSSDPPAVLREAAFSAEASWYPIETVEGYTPIPAACYAPR